MDDKSKALCDALATRIVERNFDGAYALLAPWLRAALKPSDIQRMVDEAAEGLPAPSQWTVDEGFLDVDDLRTPDPYGPPSKAVSNEVTKDNYRGWLCIQFTPGEAADDGPNVCFDLWLAAVERDGTHAVGYLKPPKPRERWGGALFAFGMALVRFLWVAT